MANQNEQLLDKIVELVGGKDNIRSATNCMTRLRIRIKDHDLIEIDKLKNTEGVMGVVEEETLQIVVGPGKAKKVADLLKEKYQVSQAASVTEDWQENKDAIKQNQNKGKVKQTLETISGIFIPMIPAIIAAGIFNGFSSLIGTMQGEGIIDGQFWETVRLLFALIGTGFLGYFAIFTGINAAKRFGATEALGGMIGAISIAAPIDDISQLYGLFDADEPLNSILTTGKGGIIGVIFGVFILAKIEKAVRKRVPDVLDLIVTPLVTLLATTLLFVFVVMPVSGFLSDWLVDALSIIIGSENAVVSVISGYILAAVFLPMVLLGLHHGLIPIYAIQLEALGGVTLFPVLAMAGGGQVGAAIAIYLISKKVGNDRMKQVIAGALPAGILGIGEPLIYGVTLPLGKPFITAGLGAGFGGAYVMMMNVMANAWGPSGLVAVPLMHADKMVHFVIGIFISYIGGFVMTYLFIKRNDVRNG
ncbi:PTS system IIB component, Glc family /PTS system IIC component, Glc family [Pelagirhabdus alkalitolerans]|uniref:PTS system IIB component, Glc family /PTS system IIC component, Glc family n=1 Tax=Pelagirhabdus alkalitolerans TaxID=1612202 RepID=A0A1G6KXC2_9BACI|nr:PTS transporter subunit EIIC [Pelagirhabdus alkalitolerans]SDC35742.1 PTS system IIB component, Glc family /PTS system IIC component, Glc family [Pelagirhabdus alkalitolerans]